MRLPNNPLAETNWHPEPAQPRNDYDHTQREAAPAGPCRVLSCYQDTRARGWLLWYCMGLAGRFQTEVDFDFSWWKMGFFRDSIMAEMAAAQAAEADVLLFSWEGTRNVPPELRAFNELWLPRREIRPGFLMALTENSNILLSGMSEWPDYLYDIAQRGRLSFAIEFIEPPAVERLEQWET